MGNCSTKNINDDVTKKNTIEKNAVKKNIIKSREDLLIDLFPTPIVNLILEYVQYFKGIFYRQLLQSNISIDKYIIPKLAVLPDGRILYKIYKSFKLWDLKTFDSYDIIADPPYYLYTYVFIILSEGIYGPRIAIPYNKDVKNLLFTEK